MKRIYNYCKTNRFYLFVLLLGTICYLALMKNVLIYSDDFLLGAVAHDGVKAMLNHFINNYMGWGGGITSLIVITFSFFKIRIWKIFNCIILIITINLFIKMLNLKDSFQKGIFTALIWIFTFVININISNETMYWMDGHIAYVFSTFQILIYLYYLYSRLIMKNKKKNYDLILMPIISFFAGWSCPQAGGVAIVIGIIFLVWSKFINKEKLEKRYIISFIFVIIGFCILYFAPGNNSRLLQTFPDFAKMAMIEKLLYRSKDVWSYLFDFKMYSFGFIPFYLYLTLGLLSLVSIKISKNYNNKIKKIINILSIVIIGFIAITLLVSINCNIVGDINTNLLSFTQLSLNNCRIDMLLPYIITLIILIISGILSYIISIYVKKPLIFIAYVSGILSQLAMLLSPYSPNRTMYIAIIFLILTILGLLKIIVDKKINIIGMVCLVIAITYDIKLSLVILFTYLALSHNNMDKYNYLDLKILFITSLFVSIFIYIKTVNNYYENRLIYEENVITIRNYISNPNKEKTIYIKRPKYELYAHEWMIIENSEWIEESVIDYYGLDSDVNLEYAD